MNKKTTVQKTILDIEALKRGKYASVKAKLIWLDSALKFGKGKKFS